MYGEYGGEGDDYIQITEDKLYVSTNAGGSYNLYDGPYGPGTKFPFYKINNSYLFGYEYSEDYPGYYRVFLLDYNKNTQEINVKELYGKKTDEERKELVGKMKNVTRLNEPASDSDEDDYVDFLLDSTPKQFNKLVEDNAFETVATFYKKGVECKSVNAVLYYNEYDFWSETDLSSYEDDWAYKIKEKINYFKSLKKTGSYEFVLRDDDDEYGTRYFYMVKITCAE